MKNWKTTLFAAILAALVTAQTFLVDGFTGSKEQIIKLISAALIAGFGVVAKDFDKSGK